MCTESSASSTVEKAIEQKSVLSRKEEKRKEMVLESLTNHKLQYQNLHHRLHQGDLKKGNEVL